MNHGSESSESGSELAKLKLYMMTESFSSIPALRRHFYVCVLLLALVGVGHTWHNRAVFDSSTANHAPLNASSEQMKSIEEMLK